MVHFEQIIEGLNLRPKDGFFGHSSVVLIQDGDENILFDTGGYGVRVALSEKIKDTPIHKVFLSHLHFDHCANIALFKNADIYVHEKELDSLSDSNSIYSDISEFIERSLDTLRVTSFTTDIELSKNTKTIHTPGHTVGHTSLEILTQKKRTVIAGDAIETYQEYLNDDYQTVTYDEPSYRKSRTLLKDNFEIIVPGHSPIIEDGVLVNSTFHLKHF